MDLHASMAKILFGAVLTIAVASIDSHAQQLPSTAPATPEATLSKNQKDLIFAVEQYILDRASQYDGEPAVQVILPSRDLPDCDNLNVTLPAGRELTSRTTLEVSCAGRADFPTAFVRADVKIEGQYFVPNQTIEINRIITADLLQPEKGDLLRLPDGTQTDLNTLVGRTAAQRLPAGRPIKASATRGADSIARGQIVQIRILAPGFSISNQGEAMTSAEVGSPIQVKTSQGKVVRGIVRAGGIVELLM